MTSNKFNPLLTLGMLTFKSTFIVSPISCNPCTFVVTPFLFGDFMICEYSPHIDVHYVFCSRSMFRMYCIKIIYSTNKRRVLRFYKRIMIIAGLGGKMSHYFLYLDCIKHVLLLHPNYCILSTYVVMFHY